MKSEIQDKLKRFLKTIRLNESTISTILGALVVAVVGVLIYNYFVKTGPQLAETEPEVKIEVETAKEGKVPQELPQTHTVSKGEFLWEIAEKYYQSGYNWVDIAQANSLKSPNRLYTGQELKIPQVASRKITVKDLKPKVAGLEAQQDSPVAKPTDTKYIVQKGDYLWKIAQKVYNDGYQWTKIAKANSISNPNLIEVGQTLAIPR